MQHHTKNKGDIGLGNAIATLLSNNIQVALPMSEHLPFDLIGIDPLGKMARIQVKFRAITGEVLTVKLSSSWADKNGSHTRKHSRESYDAIAIYCPDNHQVYFIPASHICSEACLTIRIDKPKNNQPKKVLFGKDFLDPHLIFTDLSS